jgi:polysaccharide export outer membrane protein
MSPGMYLKRRAQSHPEQYKDFKKYDIPASDSFWTVLPVDLDGDGLLDILASSINRNGIIGWRNRGENRWELFDGLFPDSGNFYEMTAADLDKDGHADIIAASLGDGIKIWPGKEGAALVARQMEIEQLADKNRMEVLEAPLENDVYATVKGVAEYKIGAGDVLEITFWNNNTPEKEEILVKPDGTISFGLLEDIKIDGLTSSQLDNLLTLRFKEYVRKPRIDVIVKEYNSKSVTMLGALLDKRRADGGGPGVYKLKGKTTLLQAITRIGGPAKDADLKNVSIRRKNGRSINLDLQLAIIKGDPQQDLILDDGDVVFINTIDKRSNRIYVLGEVAKPGAYEYTGEQMRLFDAIAEAGGATPFAARAVTKVVRGDPIKPEIFNANLKSLEEEGDQSENIILARGDMIYVPRSGWGEINLINKRITPLFQLILYPARTVIDWYNAVDIVQGDYNN